MPIRHLVLPMAGMGKRLRPLTLKTPKPLVLVDGRPMVEHVLEEATTIGIRNVSCVISPEHKAHFAAYIRKAQKRFPKLTFHTRFQNIPAGNGHAVLQAADVITGKPFVMRFIDDLMIGHVPLLPTLAQIHGKYKAPVLVLERIPRRDVSRYGVVAASPVRKPAHFSFDGDVYRIGKIVEKPAVKDAPSNLISVAGHVVTPSLFKTLVALGNSFVLSNPDALPLTVAIQVHLLMGHPIYAWEFPGRRLDCGTLDGLMATEKFFAGRK